MALNRTIQMGRLTADPVFHSTTSGVGCATFTIACERDFGAGSDGKKETDFLDCVAWRSTADFCTKHLTKGRQIVVDGRLQSRNYTDKNDNKRKAVEIVVDRIYFADSKRDGDRPASTPGTYENQQDEPTDYAYIGDDGCPLPF